MITQALLELHTVAVRDGHVVHIHAEHQATDLAGVSESGAHAGPDGDAALGFGALPVADHDFARDAHPGADVPELDVAVGALVEVHEIHVDLVPGDLGVVLGMEMEQRLAQVLQALDPHLGRREGMHPGDDADAFGVVVGSVHHVFDLTAAVGRALINDPDGDIAGGVQPLDHFLGMSVHGDHGVPSVEELRTGHPP